MHKVRPIIVLALTSTPPDTFGTNEHNDCEPDLNIQCQRWTSLMLLWINGIKSLQPSSKLWWKIGAAQFIKKYYQNHNKAKRKIQITENVECVRKNKDYNKILM